MRYILVMLSACIVLVSCTDKLDNRSGNTEALNLKIELATLSTYATENELDNINVYLFSEGNLTKEQHDIQIVDGELCYINMEYSEGDHLYLISQSDKMIENVSDNEEEFIKQKSKQYQEGSAPVFVSGGISLSKKELNSISLLRGVARIDLNIVGENIKVKKLELENMASRGTVFTQDNGEIPSEEMRSTLVADFTDNPATGLCSGVFYVFEQYSDAEENGIARITYTIDGAEKTKDVKLPSLLERNKVYKLSLVRALDVDISVETEQWGHGEETDIAPDMTTKIFIDATGSVIPQGAKITEKGDTLFFTESGGTATLKFNSFSDVECISSSETDVIVSPLQGAEKNTFTVQGMPRTSEQATAYVDLKMRNKGMITTVNPVTVVIPANAVQFFKDAELTQAVAFVDNGVDFGKYVDGTLGYLVVPEGTVLKTEGIWIRLDKADDIVKSGKDVYRVEGGFKPNDPEADGRMQEAFVTIGTDRYTFRRLNWGLPVVEINGVYWCKYNLRGNAKRFEDQISIRCDKDTIQSLESFLRDFMIPHPYYQENWDIEYPIPRSVKHLELLYRALGQGYQSGKTNGMTFKSDKILSYWGDSIMSDKYYYPGYDTYFWEEETGLLPADSLAPDGYKIPENSDFRKLVPNENFLLGTAENTKSYTVNGTNMSVELLYMSAMTFEMRQFLYLEDRPEFQGNFNMGGGYGTNLYYIFKQEGMTEPLIMMGHPYQHTKLDGGTQTVVNAREIQFACHDSAGKAWYINASDDTQPVYFKSISGNIMNYTKMIRCVKKPVNYIIE